MLALICRVCEGLIGGLSVLCTLSLLWLATSPGAAATNTAAVHTLGAYLLRGNMALPQRFSQWEARFFLTSSCVGE